MGKRLKGAKTTLERAVQRKCNKYADDYESGVAGFLADLFHGGCASGMVGSLVYYSDTLPFYQKHRLEIGGMLAELTREHGMRYPLDNWDESDPLPVETSNQNLLAWFGFEETARALAQRNGIEC